MKGWLIGWKAIAERCGLSIKTTKEYHKRYGMPVRRGPRNKPIGIWEEITAWLILYDQRKKNIKTAPKYIQNFHKTSSK